MTATDRARRAIVLGGSMAGLLAARVLSDTYDEVVVVDRDRLAGRTPRRGVPQGRHVHGLLARGQQVLDELFPGFTEQAVAAGVPTGDLGELRWYFNGKRLAPGTTGLTCVSAARPVLEAMVRDRVSAVAGITFLEQHDVLGLTSVPDGSRITGAVVGPRTGEEPVELDAELVVDASGRGSRTPVWLEELGYGRPEEERIRIDLSYCSRQFRLSADADARLGEQLSVNPVSGPNHPRGAFLSRIEDGKVAVSLTGVLGDTAPTDHEGWLDWTRTLPVPDVHDLLVDAEPLTDAVVHRFPHSQRRRYDRLDRLPAGLLVVGDAACSFNPVYGQGMTVAALESLTLRDHLARGGEPDPLAFQKDVSAVIDMPWQSSAGGDLGFPGVEGPRTPLVRAMNGYIGLLHAAATVDGRLTRTFMRVAGLVDPAPALMAPRTLLRVLLGALRARRAAPAAAPTAAAPAAAHHAAA